MHIPRLWVLSYTEPRIFFPSLVSVVMVLPLLSLKLISKMTSLKQEWKPFPAQELRIAMFPPSLGEMRGKQGKLQEENKIYICNLILEYLVFANCFY